ncbi:unnamed protein product [Amoebophrya sp. A120]|nr:unnamed protein product [Amoebophrya sp. A120]|eukprot:GSA120T00012743001.1
MWSSRLSQLMEPPPTASRGRESAGQSPLSPNASRRLRRKSAQGGATPRAGGSSASTGLVEGRRSAAASPENGASATAAQNVSSLRQQYEPVWTAFSEYVQNYFSSTSKARQDTNGVGEKSQAVTGEGNRDSKDKNYVEVETERETESAEALQRRVAELESEVEFLGDTAGALRRTMDEIHREKEEIADIWARVDELITVRQLLPDRPESPPPDSPRSPWSWGGGARAP